MTGLYPYPCVKSYSGITGTPLFGGNDNDTVGCTRPVDGGRGSILQYLHRFDIIWINAIQSTFRWHTVNNIKGIVIIDGAKATYPNSSFTTRCVIAGYGNTCRPTLQLLCYVRRLNFSEFFNIND